MAAPASVLYWAHDGMLFRHGSIEAGGEAGADRATPGGRARFRGGGGAGRADDVVERRGGGDAHRGLLLRLRDRRRHDRQAPARRHRGHGLPGPSGPARPVPRHHRPQDRALLGEHGVRDRGRQPGVRRLSLGLPGSGARVRRALLVRTIEVRRRRSRFRRWRGRRAGRPVGAGGPAERPLPREGGRAADGGARGGQCQDRPRPRLRHRRHGSWSATRCA